MLFLIAAHATTLGFMPGVNRLKFDQRILPQKHKIPLRILAGFFLLGYPWLFAIWLTVLVAQATRGRVAVADGFMATLSRRTNNPRPMLRDVAIGATVSIPLMMCAILVLYMAVENVGDHPWKILLICCVTLLPAWGSALIRTRRNNRAALPTNALFVNGLIPINKDLRHTARRAAPDWLAQQQGPVAWFADDGLRPFYEAILANWGIKGIKVSTGGTGFLSHLRPARYRFIKP